MRLEAASTILHKMAAQFCGNPDLLHALYLVPLARSRYCASPEASIPLNPLNPLNHLNPLNPLNPLNSASTLGATASAPTSRSVANCSTNRLQRKKPGRRQYHHYHFMPQFFMPLKDQYIPQFLPVFMAFITS